MPSLRDSMSDAQGPIAFLRSPSTIRARCREVLELGRAGELDHFEVRMDALSRVVDRVSAIVRTVYPSLDVPRHSRWNHFAAGGIDRRAALRARLAHSSPDERARACFALVVTSALLDGLPTPEWRYREPGTGCVLAGHEGVAVASYHMFTNGLFSSDPSSPYRADADGLEQFDAMRLGSALQSASHNPIVGLEARADLLGRLGSAMRATPRLFGDGSKGTPRLGRLFDACLVREEEGMIPARRVLFVLLEGLGPIWPGRLELLGVNLGDVWKHGKVSGPAITAGLVPFHRMSQWLTYSLIETLSEAGLRVVGEEELTGLADAWHCGLFVDDGVLVPKHDGVLATHAAGDEAIVEWRALTVALLDEVANAVRVALSAEHLTLSQIMEGGTSLAAREAAKEKRRGEPPMIVDGDGTVV